MHAIVKQADFKGAGGLEVRRYLVLRVEASEVEVLQRLGGSVRHGILILSRTGALKRRTDGAERLAH